MNTKLKILVISAVLSILLTANAFGTTQNYDRRDGYNHIKLTISLFYF